jgi:hypothetical protein
MAEKFYIGKFSGSTCDPREVLANAEVLVGDEKDIRARIDADKGLALTKLANVRMWQIWHVDLRIAFGDKTAATVAAQHKMNINAADGDKPPVWSAFLWPA